MLLLKMRPEVPNRARRALAALRRSEKEDGRRPSEFLVNTKIIGLKFELKYVFSKAITQDIYFLRTIYGALNSYLKCHYLTL